MVTGDVPCQKDAENERGKENENPYDFFFF